MHEEIEKKITSEILELQDERGCWNVLAEGDRYYPALNYYVPKYKSTLWTLILLADIKADTKNNRFLKPLKIITNHFFDNQTGIFSLGKSHFPIPCLNGNMIYLHSYFQSGKEEVIDKVVEFFAQYQRFDDGDFLEILWLLKREQVKSAHIKRALNFLKNKMGLDSTWKME